MSGNDEVKADREHFDYDWCCTDWYDGPIRAFAVVPDDDIATDPLIEVRTLAAWVDRNGDYHVRLDREELQTALDMLDGKPVHDVHDGSRVFSGRTPRWPNS